MSRQESRSHFTSHSFLILSSRVPFETAASHFIIILRFFFRFHFLTKEIIERLLDADYVLCSSFSPMFGHWLHTARRRQRTISFLFSFLAWKCENWRVREIFEYDWRVHSPISNEVTNCWPAIAISMRTSMQNLHDLAADILHSFIFSNFSLFLALHRSWTLSTAARLHTQAVNRFKRQFCSLSCYKIESSICLNDDDDDDGSKVGEWRRVICGNSPFGEESM